jgi:hypothetical protein
MVDAVEMRLTHEERTNISNMAAAMYSERVADDARMGRAEVYGKNPDARQLYFKGVHDTIMALNAWVEEGIDPNLLNTFIEALHDQTCEDTNTGHTH